MPVTRDFNTPRHPIQVVSNRTGLTPDVLRAWERRYEAVVPGRTETGRRLYSDADIERLVMLKRAMAAGRSIGQVASLTANELSTMLAEDESRAPRPPKAVVTSGDGAVDAVAAALDAVGRLDADGLRSSLSTAAVNLSETALIESVLAPLMQQVGDRWRAGSLRIVHEHLAAATVRWYLGELTRRVAPHGAKTLVVATPAGQRHEIGAMLAAATAISRGWKVIYLGPDLPAEEIATAGSKSGADAVALSVVYPTDDALLAGELTTLRRLLPATTNIFVGGQGAGAYERSLVEVGARLVSDLREFRELLDAA